MSKVLGLDQSFTSTGYCVCEGFSVIEHGVINTMKTESPLDVFVRSNEVATAVLEIIDKHGIDVINLEGLAFMSRGNVTRNLAILQGALVVSILASGFEEDSINIVTPTSLKKFATGDGKSDKSKMFDSLPDFIKDEISQYKKTKGRSDVTDAFFLAVYGNEEYKAFLEI